MFILTYPIPYDPNDVIKDPDGNIIQFETIEEAKNFRDSCTKKDIHEDAHYWINFDHKDRIMDIVVNEGQY